MMSNNLVFISNNFTDIQQTAKELKTLECKQLDLWIYLSLRENLFVNQLWKKWCDEIRVMNLGTLSFLSWQSKFMLC